jgi:hypothetical protein
MRVDVSAFGRVVSSMIAGNNQVTLLQDRTYKVGPARACVAAQLIGIALEPREVAAVLLGGAPLLSAEVSAPRWQNGRYVLDVAGPNGAQERVEFELPRDQRDWPPERQTPRLRKVELRDRAGLRAEITYDSYRMDRLVPFPDRVRVVMPRDRLDTALRFDRVDTHYAVPSDPDLPDAPLPDPFAQRQPAGTALVPLGCP